VPAKPRAKRCAYKENGRRCPFDGEGEPPLCKAHRVSLAEMARPKPPGRVLLESLGDLLQGKPINREATLGAAEDFLNQWAGNLGSQYRPDIFDGASENTVHQRAQSGTGRPWWWNIAHATEQPPNGHARPQSPPEADLIRARLAARQVMGFTHNEPLDAGKIKARHRELVRKYHPDRHPDRQREMDKKMSAINAARDVLEAAL
jgi:hypothetical protein